jgi:hypothetical protein
MFTAGQRKTLARRGKDGYTIGPVSSVFAEAKNGPQITSADYIIEILVSHSQQSLCLQRSCSFLLPRRLNTYNSQVSSHQEPGIGAAGVSFASKIGVGCSMLGLKVGL